MTGVCRNLVPDKQNSLSRYILGRCCLLYRAGAADRHLQGSGHVVELHLHPVVDLHALRGVLVVVALAAPVGDLVLQTEPVRVLVAL